MHLVDTIIQMLRAGLGYIIAAIFSLIEVIYKVFEYMARAEILDNSFIENIYSKVGMILGIFMLFKLVFSLVQSLIDPDKFTDKNNGFAAIIKRSIIAIVLLGLTPSIFEEAYRVQNLIVGARNSDNVIYKLISGKSTTTNVGSMGRVLASELYLNFFTDEEDPHFDEGIDDTIRETNSAYYDRFVENNYENLAQNLRNGSIDFFDTVYYINLTSALNNGDYLIEYNFLLLLVSGGFTLYLIFMYTVQTSIRVVQLAYLQLIAPVPILSYISDPEGTFKRWIKQCTATFLDLFIRLAIIYFVMTLIGEVINQFNKMHGVLLDSTGIGSGTNWLIKALVEVFIILGLLLFAKKVPELLKDLFPNLGSGAGKFDFGLSAKKTFNDTLVGTAFGGIAGATAGTAIGLIGGHGVAGRIKGVFGGFTKGAINGLKGKKISEITAARAAQNMKNREMRDSGSTLGGRIDARWRNAVGLEPRTAAIDRQIHDIDMNDIRPIDDRINEINNNPIMETKRRNDAIIGARKAMLDEAEKELLKAGSGSTHLRDLKERIEWARNDYANGGRTTAADIIALEDGYKSALDRETTAWIDANSSTNGVIITNMRTISNETGTTVNTAAGAKSASDSAKSENNTNAATIANLEFEKQTLENRKRTHEQQKNNLNRDKERPQANENAIKK